MRCAPALKPSACRMRTPRRIGCTGRQPCRAPSLASRDSCAKESPRSGGRVGKCNPARRGICTERSRPGQLTVLICPAFDKDALEVCSEMPRHESFLCMRLCTDACLRWLKDRTSTPQSTPRHRLMHAQYVATAIRGHLSSYRWACCVGHAAGRWHARSARGRRGTLDGGPEVGAGVLQRVARELRRAQQGAQHAACGGRPPRAVRRADAGLTLRLGPAAAAVAGAASDDWASARPV